MRIERIVQPPQLPRHQRRKRIDLSAMCIIYICALAALAGLAWFVAATFETSALGATSIAALLAAIVAYIAIGAALYAYFMRRLSYWNDANLEDAVRTKLNFIWSWPVAAGRLLAYLLIHHVLA